MVRPIVQGRHRHVNLSADLATPWSRGGKHRRWPSTAKPTEHQIADILVWGNAGTEDSRVRAAQQVGGSWRARREVTIGIAPPAWSSVAELPAALRPRAWRSHLTRNSVRWLTSVSVKYSGGSMA